MRLRKRTRLSFDRLEARDCPSFTTVFSGGTLTITGVPTALQSSNQEFAIVHTGAAGDSVFSVYDKALTTAPTTGVRIGTFNITGNINLNFSYYRSNIVLDTTGGRLPGNLNMNLGSGSLTGTSTIAVIGGGTGRVGGSVSVSNGGLLETLSIGLDPAGGGPTSDVTIGSNVSFTGRATSNDTIQVLGTGTKIGQDLIGTTIQGINIGTISIPGGTVGRNVTLSNTSVPGGIGGSSVDNFGTVGGNVTMNTVNNPGTFGFSLSNGTLFGGSSSVGSVGGSVSVNTGSYALFNMDSGTTIGGSASVTAGEIAPFFAPPLVGPPAVNAPTIGGSLTLNAGSTGSGIDLTNLVVAKNLTLTSGNGNDTVTLGATVGGTATLNLGSGTDSVDITGSIGGTTSITGGNGGVSITLDGTIGGSLYINVGNGSNSFTQSGTGVVSGSTLQYIGGSGNNTVTINGSTNVYGLYVTFGGTSTSNETVDLTGSSFASVHVQFSVLGNKSWAPPTAPANFTLINYP
jgi:hypothetical protein